jgi:hypothetical protein
VVSSISGSIATGGVVVVVVRVGVMLSLCCMMLSPCCVLSVERRGEFVALPGCTKEFEKGRLLLGVTAIVSAVWGSAELGGISARTPVSST